MIVWVYAAMMVGSAKGSCILESFCHDDDPKASAASRTSLSTSRMPRSVRRIMGRDRVDDDRDKTRNLPNAEKHDPPG